MNNSIFSNIVFFIIYSYISILESNKVFYVSPPQTSRHATVRQKINLFSPQIIRSTLADEELSQVAEIDLQRILAWFILDFFVHNLDLNSTARKIFRSKTSDNETILAEETEDVWDPEWYHILFFNIPNNISRAAIAIVSVHQD